MADVSDQTGEAAPLPACPLGGECPDCLKEPPGGWPADPKAVLDHVIRRIINVIDPAQRGDRVKADVLAYLRGVKDVLPD